MPRVVGGASRFILGLAVVVGVVGFARWRSVGVALEEGRRRLSRSDHIQRVGRLPAVNGTERTKTRFVFVHIPKAAGASFMNDSPNVMPAGCYLRGSAETGAFSKLTKQRLGKSGGHRVIFLRHPVALAYSQFLYCKFVLKRKFAFPRGSSGSARGEVRASGGLDEWTRHFPNDTSWKCYNPTDMQLRFVAGSGVGRADTGLPRDMTVEKAVGILDRHFFFVGVVEAYRESLCLFEWLTTRRTPRPHCACDATVPPPFKLHATHRNKRVNGSRALLRPDQRTDLARLVPRDLQLYVRALQIFQNHTRTIKKDTGVQIVCDAKLDAIWNDALEYACKADAAFTNALLANDEARSCLPTSSSDHPTTTKNPPPRAIR